MQQKRELFARLILLLFLGSGGWALAHHADPFSELSGARFCVDQQSVNVTSDGPGTLDVSGLRSDANELMRTLLTSLRVDWREAVTCAPISDRLRLSIEVRFLNPATYQNFPADTSSYFVMHRLEPAEGSQRVFLNTASDLFAPVEGGPILADELLDQVKLSTTKLAGDWWEQNPVKARGPPPWLIGSGSVVVLITLGVLVSAMRRRRGASMAATA